MKNKPGIIIGVFGLLILLTAATLLFTGLKNTEKPEITDIVVAKPNLVVHGKELTRVEVWVVPTGTNVTENDYQKMGDAKLLTTEDGVQNWNLAIPAEPMLATAVFAKGFAKEELVGQVALQLTGATAIYESLWGTTTEGTPVTSTSSASTTE